MMDIMILYQEVMSFDSKEADNVNNYKNVQNFTATNRLTEALGFYQQYDVRKECQQNMD